MSKGMTVRELIMALVLSGNLSDKVSIEIPIKNIDPNRNFAWIQPMRVCGLPEGETLIECYEYDEVQ